MIPINILFWNVAQKALSPLVAELAASHDASLVILAEAVESDLEMTKALNALSSSPFTVPFAVSSKLRLYARLPRASVIAMREKGGVSVRHVRHPLSDDFLVVAVHLASKRYQKADDQIMLCTDLARVIESAEEDVGHRRTIVIGDFNMNPFEAGIVGAGGLHAVMDRRVAAGLTRIVNGEARRFFYNPMWSRYGSAQAGALASYFYNSGSHVNYFWHMFDQVLLRPELLPWLRTDDHVLIPTTAGPTSLVVSSGVPDSRIASDHLPLIVKLTAN